MTNALIEFASDSGDLWMDWLIAVTLDSAALLAVVSLAWIALRRKVAPQVGYGLFLLIPLKLLLPLNVVVPPGIARWTPSAIISAYIVPLLNTATVPDSIGNPRARSAPAAPVASARPAPAAAVPNEPAEVSSVTMSSAERPLPANALSSAEMPAPASPMTLGGAATPRLTVSGFMLIVWLAGVLLLLGRMLRTQLMFHARLRGLPTIDGLQLGLDLGDLCRRAGVTQTIRIVESDDLAAPAVWGIIRPTIILPRGILLSLTAKQRQWVLLHELAHVRRRDLPVVVVQRLAAVLHFFNPVVWIANRCADRLREYACDDLADAVSEGSAIESSEAFVELLRHVNRSRQTLDGALGVFGWDSRAACFLRVRRLLDSTRPMRTSRNPWALSGLLLLAAVALPHLRAAVEPADSPNAANRAATKNRPKPEAPTDEPLTTDVGEFALRVVGPDAKPVPEAMVHLDGNTTPTADQVRRGTFVRKAAYGVYVKSDQEGRLAVEVPKTLTRWRVSIETPGYGPYFARWSSESYAQPIPARFTVELEAAWSVGGIILDSDGKPVAGVQVHPSIEFKKRPGDQGQLGVGQSAKTDDAGKWRYESVPVSIGEVYVEIDHPGFKPEHRGLSRAEFGLKAGAEPGGRIVLDRGLVVTGRVTDDAGKPISGALIRTKFSNDRREAKTGNDGIYWLAGCEPRMTKIVVSAKGRATDMQEVLVDREMPPVNFQMQPGGHVRIRVLDDQGNPVPKARIFFQRWRGPFFDYFEFDHVSQYADDQGVWEWNEAPLDEFKADICPIEGMQLGKQSLIARDEEYVFRTPPALVISGRVTDAKTKQPIEKFAVVPGSRFSESRLSWSDRNRFTVDDGKYQIRHTHPEFAHLVRIEAEGYQIALSRDIQSNEGNVTIDFALEKGTDVSAAVLTPEGRPASKAGVALGVAGAQISIRNGDLFNPSTFCARQETNQAGQFRFPAQDSPFELVILHPTGFAHVKVSPDSIPSTIRLKAWARIEGTFRVGNKPVPGVTLGINGLDLESREISDLRISSQYNSTTDAEGHFFFERVFPGQGRIGREVVRMVKEGIIPFGSACMIPLQIVVGETKRIDLGGTGRPIVGKLEPPKGFQGQVKWNFVSLNLGPRLGEVPRPDGPDIPDAIAADRAKRTAWMLKWQLTPAGKGWAAWNTLNEAIQQVRNNSPYFEASINRDGTFRFDDVPAGEYVLSGSVERDVPGSVPERHFKVPPIDDSNSDEPLDLGVLTLEN